MPRGGKRKGAGRPKGSLKNSEPRKLVSVPVRMIDDIKAFVERNGLTFPFYDGTVQAGFPSPAEDISCEMLNIGDFLIHEPASTIIVKAKDDSMKGSGIYTDDLLLVEQAVNAVNGDIVFVEVDGEFMIRRYLVTRNKLELHPENRTWKTILFNNEEGFTLLGVVKSVIHHVG